MTEVPESPEVAQERMRREFDKLDEKFGPRYFNMEGQPVSMWDWAMGIELRQDRHVGDTYLRLRGRVYRVSTVLLGLDHSFSPWPHKPVIFETMVFVDGDMAGEFGICERYCTKEQAKAGHARIVAEVRKLVRKEVREMPRPKQLIDHGGKP